MARTGEMLMGQVKGSLIGPPEQRQDKPKVWTEEELAKKFGVSRGMIREVLTKLEREGLIDRRRRKGTSLRRPGIKELVDLWDTRCALEAMAARLACANVTDSDLQKLEKLLEQRRTAATLKDQQAIDRTDIAFHQTIIDVSTNTCIRDMVRNTHLFDRIFHIATPLMNNGAQEEDQPYSHRHILDALAQRDPDRIETLVKQHIQQAKKRRIEALIGKIDAFD